MFHLIQSNDTSELVRHLLRFYRQKQSVFAPFLVIVPSMVLGDWLRGQIAKQSGISTLLVAEFWGKYQWQMMSEVLKLDEQAHPHDALSVPEVAVLSGSIMRWRMFAFLSQKCANLDTLDDDDPLTFLLKPLIEHDQHHASINEQRLWQLCQELSNVYVRYLTHRPTWLLDWALDKSLQSTVKKMMATKAKFDEQFIVVRPELDDIDDKDQEKATPEPMPEWLQEHYLNLEKALHLLWRELFGQTYLYRHELESRFWQVLSGERGQELALSAKQRLQTLHLFTVQQIPQVELDFLKKLSQYCEVYLLHFNPSAMFWADIVDKQWLEHQRIINREKVYLKDYGHGLLSRLGKESRETFAMLVDMAGMAEQGNTWQDDFITPTPPTLLNNIKTDILMLQKSDMAVEFAQSLADETLLKKGKKRPKTTLSIDDTASLSIHACHSLKRQLELARLYIAQYLNTPKADGKLPTLSEVVVLLPDVASAEDLIRAVFPEGYGMDGLMLPIKITGTPDKNIANLLDAMLGFYELLGKPTSRFYAKDVYEWLLMPPLYEAFGLTFEQMSRACELLKQAGFKRGFDERHLSATLADGDADYRYTFSYALDRVVLGLLSPNPPEEPHAYDTLHPFAWQPHAFAEKVLPLAGVQLADEPVIIALTAIHEALHRHRDDWVRVAKVEQILDNFEQHLINRYFGKFAQTVEMRAIFNTKNTMMASLRANKYYRHHLKRGGRGERGELPDIYLTHEFVLQSLSDTTKSQAVSAEPSSVITVAKFGAVRSIPFGLTLMLDMNLSSFPRQDQPIRLDLMRAGLKWRGDRYHEDDDNGAFLDALLCTDKVMIFYNGLSPDGKTELLPASPVSELLRFLTEEALWQERPELGELNILMPKLIKEYLVTHHTATPFDRQNFYESVANTEEYQHLQALKDTITTLKRHQQRQLPPPPLWQNVHQTLLATHTPSDKVALLDPSEQAMWTQAFARTLTLASQYRHEPSDDHAQTLYAHIQALGGIEEGKPTAIVRAFDDMIGAFLTPKIGKEQHSEADEIDEPLQLGGLGTYRVHDAFLQAVSAGAFDGQDSSTQQLEALYYEDLLPAGVMRQLAPNETRQVLNHQLETFITHLRHAQASGLVDIEPRQPSDYITPLVEERVAVGVGGLMWGFLTDKLPRQPLWLSVRANRPTPKYLLLFWVQHLLWQIADDGVRAKDKRSIWHFKGTSSALKDTQFKDKQTFTLPPIDKVSAMAYLSNLLLFAKLIQDKPIIMTLDEAMIWLLNKDKEKSDDKVSKTWLKKVESDRCWQFVLGSHEPLPMLLAHMPMMVVLLSPLIERLATIDVDTK